ncbi:MAG: YebC/PmpR family DNA-binding transcriptional regulator [Candidatus Kerfeldbacteria bacterium]|nr:YebC/PmpR family DNA-binding transcriptional regulator [Candidatus Kerfeldbacteria bacterium]
MSGHSKWSTIKRSKGAVDAKRGVLFTRLSKAVSLAAKQGKDPAMNAALRSAIDAAREANMPKDNIERAILRGAGELPGQHIEEVTYEAYGPAGVALMIHCATDNTNRTSSTIKALLNIYGGKLGGPGSVAYLFKQRGIIRLNQVDEATQLQAMDAGADDVVEEDDGLTIYTPANLFSSVRAALGANVTFAELGFVPDSTVTVPTDSTLGDILTALADDDDIVAVYHNAKF